MRGSRWWFPTLLASLLWLGCPTTPEADDDTGDDDTADDDTGDDDTTGCESECSAGESRCNGDTVEACYVDPDDCGQWIYGTDCAALDQVCDDSSGSAVCVDDEVDPCENGVQDDAETDVDCGGGVCEPCDVGGACLDNDDCASATCDIHDTWTCLTVGSETCGDGYANQDESDTDCGGAVCPACDLGMTCLESTDCATGNCDVNDTWICVGAAEETCGDGALDQDETDVDCGGAVCDPCGDGLGCDDNADCASAACDVHVSWTCLAPGSETCGDGLQNQDESDADCGGLLCPACALGDACNESGDCDSGNCATFDSWTCVDAATETCDDGVLDQDESDLDCGGLICPGCDLGEACAVGSDCDSGNCAVFDSWTCVDPGAETCGDGVANQDESDADCGGALCPACDDGQLCWVDFDCQSVLCDVGITDACVPAGTEICSDALWNQDETDVDCGGALCDPCAVGDDCLANDDCDTALCDVGLGWTCVDVGTETCGDGLHNLDESDVDCGGGCPDCAEGNACGDHDDCASEYCDPFTDTCEQMVPQYQVNEDFETGDLTRFPWETIADQGNTWEVTEDPALCHGGDFCLRTSPFQEGGETATASVALSVREDTDVTFWVYLNTEPGEHRFRFYVDGVEQDEFSGQQGWQLLSYPVPATGANGPDRVLTWEYERSTFVDPNHPAWNEVYIDDVDMPDWNSGPLTPEIVAPGDGAYTADVQPLLQYWSFDADFDPITYTVEIDDDAAFGSPESSGEIFDTQWSPAAPLADGVYFWRARAKDDSDYRWSEWSTVASLEVDASFGYSDIWLQHTAEQFQMGDLSGVQFDGDTARNNRGTYSGTEEDGYFDNNEIAEVDFTGLPDTIAGIDGTITFRVKANYNDGYVDYLRFENESWHDHWNPNTNTCDSYSTRSKTVPGIYLYVNDGSAHAEVENSNGVNCCWCGDGFEATLSYDYPVAGGVITSPPIDLTTFPAATLFNSVHVVGSGTLVLQLLDEGGALVPDDQVPGNAAGITDVSVHLWDLDPAAYPVIRLRLTLESLGAELEEWSVVVSDRHEFRFDVEGDTEGWEAGDAGATPSIDATAGALLLESGAGGTDPHALYTFPAAIDATRFGTLAVTIRTSNNAHNDDVTLMWESNYGGFDPLRSTTIEQVFLYGYQELLFDLTEVPVAPNQPWQGQIDAIRIDGVVEFLDEIGDPTDGWFEIDAIALY